MSNQLSAEVKAQIFSQESNDPFLTLVTLEHEDFTIKLVNNTTDINSRASVFYAMPMKIRLPADDGETTRDFSIEFDNVSLEIISQLRQVTGDINVTIEFILASLPNVVQMSHENLLLRGITYNAKTITASIVFDDFLAIGMTSEKYTPSTFPGLFT